MGGAGVQDIYLHAHEYVVFAELITSASNTIERLAGVRRLQISVDLDSSSQAHIIPC